MQQGSASSDGCVGSPFLSPAFFWHLWQGFGHLSTVSCDLSMFFGTYPRDIGQAISPVDELFTYGHAAAHR